MESTGNEKIVEALKLLDTAAKDKKDELRELLNNRYSHLKSALADTEYTVIERLTSTLKDQIETLVNARNQGQAKVREAAGNVDEHVHTNPWPYLGGAAVISLLGGYLMGLKMSSNNRNAS